MSVLIIPVIPSLPCYRFGITIEGAQYLFDLTWNDRDAAWYLDVRNVDESAIVVGIRIVLGTFLGRLCQAAPFTTGVLVAIDTSNQSKEATLDDLGTRVSLRYFPLSDLAVNYTDVNS